MPHDGFSPITWRVSAHVVAVKRNRLLLVEPEYLSGRLELPGGEVEADETLLEGATRECWEETGYGFRPTSPDPIFVVEQFFCSKPGATYRHSAVLAFVGDVTEQPDPKWQAGPEDEGTTVYWVDLADLNPDTLHPNHWLALAKAGVVPGGLA